MILSLIMCGKNYYMSTQNDIDVRLMEEEQVRLSRNSLIFENPIFCLLSSTIRINQFEISRHYTRCGFRYRGDSQSR